jgi:organic hydroperoxide reductase OsmC/OhrA
MRQEQEFTNQQYSRKHEWVFDGGVSIPASSSPKIVPTPFSETAAVDPEEAFVASLSSCHMLWFLSIASERDYIVEDYKDEAKGIMDKDREDKQAITKVILKPIVYFGKNQQPEQHVFEQMHHQAHKECFIAHSVKTEISINANLRVIP